MKERRSTKRDRILELAATMVQSSGRVNKSRIARELHVPLRTVFRVLVTPGRMAGEK